jgi:hypothetical protein
MNPKKLLTIIMLLCVVFLFGTFGQAHAVPMQYDVSGTLSGGGLLTGSMEIDSDAGWLNNIIPTTWTFMTSGGIDPNGNAISNFTYSPLSSSLLFNSAVLTFIGDLSTGRSLTFSGYSPLLNEPGPYAIGSIKESYKYSNSGQIGNFTFTHNIIDVRTGSGSAASLPEPASILLFGSGIAALGALGYRKDKKA